MSRGNAPPCARRLPAWLALLLLAAAVGCGGEPGSRAPRLGVATWDFDAPPPEGLWLIDAGGEKRPLRPIAPGLYEAPGAPEGPFRVEGPGGWRMLSLAPLPPELRRDRTPPVAHLTPPNALYVGATDPELRPGRRWGARALDDEGARPVPVTVEEGEGGLVVALRFAPEDWQGRLEVVGHLARTGGAPLRDEDVGEGPLADPIAFAVPEDRRALVHYARPAQTATLDVRLVGETTGGAPRRVVLEALDLPLDLSRTRAVEEGRARFARWPQVGRPLRLRVEPGGRPSTFAPEVLRDAEAVWVLAPPAGGGPARPLPDALEALWVRPDGAEAWARAARVPDAPASVVLERDGRFAVLAFEAGDDVAAGIAGALEDDAAFAEGVTVQGVVEGLPPTPVAAVVRLYRQEADGAFTGHGLTRRLAPHGSFAFRLPPGIYEVEVETPAGRARRERPVEATAPGGHHHVRVEAPAARPR